MKHIVVLTGAGMSAESGVKTFRDHDGLWEGHDVTKVASPEGFRKDPEMVLDFYNQRRRQLHTVQPNAAHKAIAKLERNFKVSVVTQNIDDLHERAGSSDVLHLHGELKKVRSVGNPDDIMVWTEDLVLGDLCKEGYQLRPHVVWFGEPVPMMEQAIHTCFSADILVIIGTSMQVYPANGLIHYVNDGVPIFYIDPKPALVQHPNITAIAKTATEGMKDLQELLNQMD